MGKYISFAKFNKKHLYIVFSILSLILKDVMFGYNYNDSFEPLFSSEQAYENFSENYLIKNILCYIVTFILSFVFLKIERRRIRRDSLKKIENDDNVSVISSTSKIKYIHNYGKIAYLSSNTFLFFLFIIFIWILDENLIQLFSFLKDLDFWMIEIIIISYMTSIMFKEKIYLHHKVIIYFNLIPVICKIIAIILSFRDKCNIDNEDDYYYIYNYDNETNHFDMCLSKNENASFYNETGIVLNGGLKNIYVKNTILVPIGIFVYIILITARSYANSSIKWLMDLKYISEKKLLMIYGLMGGIICSIICIITTSFECKGETTEKDIYDYICKVKYENKSYFDNFNAFPQIFQDNKNPLVNILKTVLGIICFYFNKYFSILIIKNFTPVHLIFSFPVYYLIQKIILIINTLIKEHSFFSKNRINYIEAKFSLDVSGDILSSIGFLIYLEIIELNFCKLNYNLRRIISDRADDEKYGYLGIEDEDEIENEMEKEMKIVTSN